MVVSPLPTICSQNGIETSAAHVPWWTVLDFPPPITKPSQTSSRTAVVNGGDPKCMATGLFTALRIWRLPRMSSCGIGVSNMATFS